MKLHFHKYHGNGNDFILLDNRDNGIKLDVEAIEKLCHRRFGIGSDGVLLIGESEEADYDLVFYNPDGSQSFCGNGSRCALHFANKLGIIEREATFSAIDGIHEGTVDEDYTELHMGDVGEIRQTGDHYEIDTGSPHYVRFVDNLDELDVYSLGQEIRNSEAYKPRGINVNFVQVKEGIVHSRIYERGVENETYSSGTGTTAVGLCAYLHEKYEQPHVRVTTKGGTMALRFKTENGRYSDIWLCGMIVRVFEGHIEI